MALAGGAIPASAADIWISFGTTVQGYNLGGSGSGTRLSTTGSAVTLSGSFTAFTNAFSLTTDSSQNLYVGDAGANRVLKFNSTGAYQGVFNLPEDTAGGGINPQQIEIDSTGALYTVGYGGAIYKFTSAVAATSGTATTPLLTIPGTRGIVVKGTTMWVSTSGLSGAKIISVNLNTLQQTTIYTSNNYPDGQLRGMDVDTTLNRIYFADSTWNSTTGKIQYVSSLTANQTATNATTVASGLQGPNSIGLATVGNGGNSRLALFVADYYDNRILTVDYNNGGTVGTLVGSLGAGATGLAFNTTVVSAGDFIPELTWFDTSNVSIDNAPEPSTWILIGSAMLMLFTAKSMRERRQVARVTK
jgi:hypothetical protein